MIYWFKYMPEKIIQNKELLPVIKNQWSRLNKTILDIIFEEVKVITMLIVILILSAIIGCTQKNHITEFTNIELTNVFEKTTIKEPVDLPPFQKFTPNHIYTYNDRIYLIYYYYQTLEGSQYAIQCAAVQSVDMNGENITFDEVKIPNERGINSVYVLSDGSYFVSTYDFDRIGNMVLGKYYKIKNGEISVLFNSLESFLNVTKKATIFYLSTEDELYIKDDDKVYILSLDTLKYTSFKYDDSLLGNEKINKTHVTQNGQIIYETFNYEYFTYDNKYKLIKYNIDNIPKEYQHNNQYRIMFGKGYDIYFICKDGIYGYDYKNKSGEIILNWLNSDIVYTDYSVNLLKIISPDKILCAINDPVYNIQINAVLLTKVPDDEVVPKNIITLAHTNFLTENIYYSVMEFNMTNNKYRIVIQNYDKYNTEDKPNGSIERLNLDLANNIIPDMMITIPYFPIRNYISKGLFFDYYKFLDSDTIDNLLNYIKSSQETDNKLYILPIFCTLSTVIGKTSTVGDLPYMTIDDLIVLNENKNNIRLFTSFNKMDYLLNSVISCLPDFINYEKSICNFNSETFIKFLSLINNTPDFVSETENIDLIDNNAYLTQTGIYTLKSFMNIKLGLNNENYTIKGYPSNSGNGSLVSVICSLSVTTKSKYNEGIIEFIKFLLSDENQQLKYKDMYLPLTNTGLQKILKDMRENYIYVYDAYNDRYETHNKNTINIDRFYNNSQYITSEITDEDITKITEFFKLKINNNYNQVIMDIINEEARILFSGTITAEQCASYIQNRINIYINE